MSKYFKIVFLIALFKTSFSFACTVFVASDGKSVLVGNNEDNTPSLKSYLWFNPAQQSKYGFVTWGNIKKLPEGGMNEKGLFWDVAAMPNRIPIVIDKNKENFKGYFVEKALSECATVDELLLLISKYNLIWQEKAQILVADASGNYAIIHSNYILCKSEIQKNYFSLANYCLNDPNTKTYQCHRQGYAEKKLRENSKISIKQFKNILEKTAQTDITNSTLYSQICDLKNGIFHLFQKYDFNSSKVLNLNDELKKGERAVEIKDYFPKNIADEVKPLFNLKEYFKATELYNSLSKSEPKNYDFAFRCLDDLGYWFIREKKYNEAIEVFKLNLKQYPKSDNALASLASGYLANQDFATAKKYFKESQSVNPNNYISRIFNPDINGTITFKLNHFEGVERLSLVGAFNEYQPNTNPFVKDKNGVWTCKITLKPGTYTYKLLVGDGNWYLDPFNKFLVKPDKYWENYLIVE